MIFPDMIPGPDVEDTPDCHRCGELSMTLNYYAMGDSPAERCLWHFLRLENPGRNPLCFTHKLNKHKFIGKEKENEKQKKNGVCFCLCHSVL